MLVAVSSGLTVIIGVPLGMADPDHPNISATLWRTVADHDARRYYFESTLRPAVFWVDLDKTDLQAGADVMRLETLGSKLLFGEVSSEFEPAEPFKFMTA